MKPCIYFVHGRNRPMTDPVALFAKRLNVKHIAASAAMVICAMTPAVAFAEAGIDPWVSDQLDSKPTTEFIVRLHEQAQFDEARQIQDVLQRRTSIVENLRETATASQADLVTRLEQLGVNYRAFWITNAILVEGDRELLNELRNRPEVAHIHANPSVAMDIPQPESRIGGSFNAIEWNIALIGAPDVWAQGFDGTGVVVGGQDTGYEWDHPAIRDQYRGWNGVTADHNYSWHDAIHVGGGSCPGDSPVPCDDNNHGTHTMGTMVGDDGGSNQIGVAPGAKWIGCRNMDSGNGTPASYIECFEWFIAPTDLNGQNPNPAMAPHVINNSWSCPVSEGCVDPNVMLDVVNSVTAAGILVVVSAGNSGSGCSSVSTPSAIYEASFTVGSTNSSDNIAGSSSRGPVTVDGSNRLKPEISGARGPGSFLNKEWNLRIILRNQYGGPSCRRTGSPHDIG